MMNQMQVAITVNAKGKPVAFRYSPMQARWFRIALDEARIAIATGQAVKVPFCSWSNGQPSALNQ
jgi:hypothetical protein